LPRSKRASRSNDLPFRVEQKARNIHLVTMTGATRAGWEQWFLLRSDAHHDNPHSDHDLQRKHLQQCVERNAGWIDGGDLFCAMGGRADPRRAKHGVTRDEHATAPDYFDSLVRHAADFLQPYADRCVVLGRGNHETSVLKQQETDLTERLAERLRERTGASVFTTGYGGFIQFRFSSKQQIHTLTMAVYHGSGGGGMMTFDTLRVRRQASFQPDADILVCGHVHERWWLQTARYRLRTRNGDYRVSVEPQHHIRTGTYKQELEDGYAGFAVERGMPPKPIGAMWMRLFMQHVGKQNGNSIWRLACEFTEAS
jgi:predicted phosphodiesterase